MGQVDEVHVETLQRQVTAGAREHQLPVELLLRKDQGHIGIPGDGLLRHGPGVVVRVAVGEEDHIRGGKVRMGLENGPPLGSDGGEAHDPAVVDGIRPEAHGPQVDGDTGVGAESDLAVGHG